MSVIKGGIHCAGVFHTIRFYNPFDVNTLYLSTWPF